MQVADKTVVIAGLGVSGTSLAEVLRERGIHVIGVDERKPEADLHSFDDVVRKRLGAETIADCPVIHIGQKALRCRQRYAVIPDMLQQKSMEGVFFIIKMR